jgi:hypothetical protein
MPPSKCPASTTLINARDSWESNHRHGARHRYKFIVRYWPRLAKNAHRKNGHNLLGAKIHKNGKHGIGKIGANAVVADVSNDKVVGMSAGNLPVKRFKSTKKMADLNGDKLQVAANGEFRLAQADTFYCFALTPAWTWNAIGTLRLTSS